MPSLSFLATSQKSPRKMEDAVMKCRLVSMAVASLLLLPLTAVPDIYAQGEAQTGTISGRVVDDEGIAVAGAQVFINQSLATQTRANGQYVLSRVPAGTHTLNARSLGLRPASASVTVS